MSDDIYLARFEYAKLTEQAAIPVIIVTANQDDYPRRYVARLWDMSVQDICSCLEAVHLPLY